MKITNVALDVRSPSTTIADQVEATLRTGASDTTLAITHFIPLSGSGIARHGQLETNYYVGSVSEPSATTWRVDVCLGNLEPAGITSFKAVVTGELL